MMRATRIFSRAILGAACLLLVTHGVCSPTNSPAAANDPPLPQPGGNPFPPPAAPPAAPSSPVTVVSPPPAASSSRPAPAPAPAVPLQSSSGAPVTTSLLDSDDSDTATAFDNVEWADPNLASKLTILRVGSNRTDANLLTVFVGLKNKTVHVLHVEVQTIYKDGSGRALTQGTGNWIPMKLKPHEEAQYRSVAISVDAADFLVRIRRAATAPTGD